MTSHYPTELDSGTTDSVTSSPRSDHRMQDDTTQPRLRFMCSFGGKILPRPHDNQLRYVGGDTRMVAVQRHTNFSSLLNKLSKLSGTTNITMKYQLPNEDLDALITVTTDEDVDNMMEEYERLAHNHTPHSKTARLRLFLFSADSDSRTSSISSLLNGSAKREHWFFDALNGGSGPGSLSGLERGQSEASSIVSEMPDYLFGLDNSDDPPRESKLRTRSTLADNISVSDPGSPAPVVSSPFCSTSSSLAPSCVSSIPDLPPVKTRLVNPVSVVDSKETQVKAVAEGEPTMPQQTGNAGNPMWHYVPESHYSGPAMQHIPIYYVPGPVPPGNVPVQSVPIRRPYVQQFPAPPGQVPVGFHPSVPGVGQVYGGGGRTVGGVDPYDMSARVVTDVVNQQLYYGVRNAGVVPAYQGMVVPGGEELQGVGTEMKVGRVFQSS